ncbi:MAG: hypothetical protein ACRDLY_02845 [Thermoleophilaceae bacterium]
MRDTTQAPEARDRSPTTTEAQSQPPGAAPALGARSWIQVGRLDGQTHTWSSAERWYQLFEVWETDDGGPRLQFGLGYVPAEPGRDYYGHPRGYWIVHEMVNHRLGTELAVFVEAEQPTDLVAVIRGNGPNGRSMFDPGEDVPAGYENLTVDVFRDHVIGPQAYGKLAVVAVNGDRQAMLNHAAIQWAR